MANSKNKLKIIYFVQEYTKMQQQKGIPNTRIIRNLSVIYPISEATFYNYIAVNARAELKKNGISTAELDETAKQLFNLIPETYNKIQNNVAQHVSGDRV